MSNFQFSSSVVPSIVCAKCGSTASCMRRVPDPEHKPFELRTYECKDCDTQIVQLVANDGSDADVQALAERLTGTPPKPGKQF